MGPQNSPSPRRPLSPFAAVCTLPVPHARSGCPRGGRSRIAIGAEPWVLCLHRLIFLWHCLKVWLPWAYGSPCQSGKVKLIRALGVACNAIAGARVPCLASLEALRGGSTRMSPIPRSSFRPGPVIRALPVPHPVSWCPRRGGSRGGVRTMPLVRGLSLLMGYPLPATAFLLLSRSPIPGVPRPRLT